MMNILTTRAAVDAVGGIPGVWFWLLLLLVFLLLLSSNLIRVNSHSFTER